MEKVTDDERQPVFQIERQQRLLHRPLLLGRLELVLLTGMLIHELLAQRLPRPMRFHRVDGLVDGNAIEPTEEAARRVVRVEALVDFQKYLLREVFRLLTRGAEADDGVVYGLL